MCHKITSDAASTSMSTTDKILAFVPTKSWMSKWTKHGVMITAVWYGVAVERTLPHPSQLRNRHRIGIRNTPEKRGFNGRPRGMVHRARNFYAKSLWNDKIAIPQTPEDFMRSGKKNLARCCIFSHKNPLRTDINLNSASLTRNGGY